MVKIKQQYDVLFHHMTQGAFFQAKNSSLIDVNSAALKMFGLTREQFLGRTSLHPEWKVVKEDGSDLAPEQHPSMIALRTGQEVADVIVGVYNPLHRDFTWLNVNATPLFRENEDTPYQVFVTLHDLSSTLQMKALYQSRLNLIECADSQTLEELLVYTLDEVEKLTNSRIGFYHFYDSETQAISLNAWSTKTTELFCQVSDAQGHYPLAQAGVWVDCVREDRPVIHNDYESLPHRKGLPEGHAPLIRELVVPVKRHGQIVALLGVGNKPANYTESDLSTVMLFADLAWDIAEKKRTEEALRKSQSLLAETERIGKVGGWEFDIDSGKQIWTEEVYSIHEVAPDYEPNVEAGINFYTPDSRPIITTAVQQAVKQGEPFDLELEITTAKGKLRVVHAIGKADLETRKVYGFIQDITERKHAEKELLKVDKLESIGTLAGGIAHDFNNILAGIYGNVSLAKSKLVKDFPDHPGFHYLEAAEKSMNRATALTNQLLTFSKGGVPVKESINLSRLIDEVVPFNLSGSNVKPVISQPENLWLVSVDPGQIQQVLGNLIINAKQAMPEGGQLQITLANTEIQNNQISDLVEGRYVKITLADSGIGIKPEQLKRIFDPYFTTKQFGSGLGLATVYSIIKKHNGHIDGISQLGQGTTFTLYLPVAEDQELPAQQVSSVSAPQQGVAHILVMDDDEMICDIVKDVLEDAGHRAEIVPNGTLALDRYRQAVKAGTPFDLVILDLTIPGDIGGKEVVKQILCLHPQAKVIVSSGYADDPVMANYADYGFKGVISKPYSLDKLSGVLAQVMEND